MLNLPVNFRLEQSNNEKMEVLQLAKNRITEFDYFELVGEKPFQTESWFRLENKVESQYAELMKSKKDTLTIQLDFLVKERKMQEDLKRLQELVLKFKT